MQRSRTRDPPASRPSALSALLSRAAGLSLASRRPDRPAAWEAVRPGQEELCSQAEACRHPVAGALDGTVCAVRFSADQLQVWDQSDLLELPVDGELDLQALASVSLKEDRLHFQLFYSINLEFGEFSKLDTPQREKLQNIHLKINGKTDLCFSFASDWESSDQDLRMKPQLVAVLRMTPSSKTFQPLLFSFEKSVSLGLQKTLISGNITTLKYLCDRMLIENKVLSRFELETFSCQSINSIKSFTMFSQTCLKDAYDYLEEYQDRYCPFTSYVVTSRASRHLVIIHDFLGLSSAVFSSRSKDRFRSMVSLAVSEKMYDDIRRNTLSLKSLHCTFEPLSEDNIEDFANTTYLKKYTGALVYMDLDTAKSLDLIQFPNEESEICSVFLKLAESFLRNYCPMVVVRFPRNMKADITRSFTMFEKIVRKMRCKRLPCGSQLAFMIGIKNNVEDLNKNNMIATISSRRQFQFVYRKSSGDFPQRLQQMIRKHVKQIQDKRVRFGLEKSFLQISRSYDDDEVIYRKMAEEFDKNIRHFPSFNSSCNCNSEEDLQAGEGRSDARASEISHSLPLGFEPKCLLDIGCSEGNITSSLGRHFRLPPEQTFGCDVRDVSKAHKGFVFSRIPPSNVLPYETASIDLCVCLMVLHHVESLDALLSEIRRVVRPGGYFVIREHDCNPPELSVILDIMHGLYALVFSKPREMPQTDFAEYFYSLYRSREEWKELIEVKGFQQVFPTENAERLYNIKVDDIRAPKQYVENPFRFYYSIFQVPAE